MSDTLAKREYLLTIIAIALGAIAVIWGYSLSWDVTSGQINGLPVPVTDVSGRSLRPLPAAGGWVALAAVPAILATRVVGRRIISVILALAGIAAFVGGMGYLPASALGAAGGLALAVLGVWTFVRTPGWPGMSTKYERTKSTTGQTRDVWAALDRGEDPTQDA